MWHFSWIVFEIIFVMYVTASALNWLEEKIGYCIYVTQGESGGKVNNLVSDSVGHWEEKIRINMA